MVHLASGWFTYPPYLFSLPMVRFFVCLKVTGHILESVQFTTDEQFSVLWSALEPFEMP